MLSVVALLRGQPHLQPLPTAGLREWGMDFDFFQSESDRSHGARAITCSITRARAEGGTHLPLLLM